MLKKSVVEAQLKNFPDEFSIDELINRLILIEKVNRASKQSETGEVITEDELDKEWFQ